MKRISICIIIILISSFLTTSCAKKNLSDNNNKNTQTSEDTTKNTVEQGDGTITISLNVSNPEQRQEKYNLIFMGTDLIQVGEANHNFKSFVIDSDASATVNISDVFNTLSTDSSGNFQIWLTVARIEDEYVRNPLSELICLTTPDFNTCNQGKDIKLDMTDKPLTSLYPEGTLLVKIIDSEKQGGYVDFKYKSTSNMTLTFGRGSAGPDFLVAFDASEFKESGIRDTTLEITDTSNHVISEQINLQFDENGYCKQGQYIEIKVAR